MSTVQIRGEAVRRFIVDNVAKHPADITRRAAEKFACSRQAIHKHLQRLIDEGCLLTHGATRNRTYSLAALVRWERDYELKPGLSEDAVWRLDIAPLLGKLPDNAEGIWHYGITEMINNVIDHSGGTILSVQVDKTAAATQVQVFDDGVGIFRKIQAAMGLLDERHAVLELAKGKFTTDPSRHTGEGIFFSSRAFDEFEILSGDVYFSHEFHHDEDWIVQRPAASRAGGTLVRMRLNNHTSRRLNKVFAKFASTVEPYGFNKTVVPVKLMRYGDDNLVSRSQAKRLIARFERFKIVILDFTGVATIGQAFADEVFRVFARQHPEVDLVPMKVSAEVKRMISRAQAHDSGEGLAPRNDH
ncbi:MAG: DUF4325 domain-containing protein [Pseudomonadota bacterium]|nr:DUF4325 domain-containing protein [Pseudomonadota bacterium]